MASTAIIKIEKRLDELEARIGALESGYVRVPPPKEIPIVEQDKNKPNLMPDKETKNDEQDNRADPGNSAVKDVDKDDSKGQENSGQADS